jgi:hypothetical protein
MAAVGTRKKGKRGPHPLKKRALGSENDAEAVEREKGLARARAVERVSLS